MLFGFIAIIFCILLLFLFIARKLQWNNFALMLKKLHLPLGFLLIIAVIIHIFLTLPVWNTRNILVLGSGITAGIFLFVIAASYLFRKKIKKSWLSFHKITTVFFVLLIISHIAFYNMDFISYKSNIKTITIEGLNATHLPDGNYIGSYDAGYIYAKVKVFIQDGQIQNIQLLKHENERGSAAESILDHIVAKQTTKVDVISSATNSSLVIEKAVENALKGK